jgi:hypothetical protein
MISLVRILNRGNIESNGCIFIAFGQGWKRGSMKRRQSGFENKKDNALFQQSFK